MFARLDGVPGRAGQLASRLGSGGRETVLSSTVVHRHADPIHDTVLVTGATGLHGGAVAQALLAAGRRVRALTRDGTSARSRWLADRGAELAVGDLLDTRSLVAAMRGAAAVYGVTTPFAAGEAREIEQGTHIIAAADHAQVPWLILASVASANRSTGIPHFESKARIEQHLRASRVPHTVVAPTYFYENVGDPASIVASGELSLPLPASRPLQQVAVADLGALVVALLDRREDFVGHRIEVAGDEPTPQEMAEALSAAGGRPVRYEPVDLGGRTGDIVAMYRYLERTGYQADIAGLRERFPEVAWTSFAHWAEQQLALA
jgi:uncharacterized protein YbjT (DUF2867 family)